MSWFTRNITKEETTKEWHERIDAEWELGYQANAIAIGIPTHEIIIDGRKTLATQAGHGYYVVQNGAATKVAPYHKTEVVGFPMHTAEDRGARALLIPIFEKMAASESTEPYVENLGMGLTSPAIRYIGAHGFRGPCAHFYTTQLRIWGLRGIPERCDITTAERARFEAMIAAKTSLPPVTVDELLLML